MENKRKKILIVDDLKAWRESIASILENEDYSLDFAATLENAQKKLKQEKFDLCIIDIRLQEDVDYNVEGIDLLEWIHKNKQGQPPAIILTGHATEALKQKADWYKAFAFLEKSPKANDFDLDRVEFLNIIEQALKKRHKRK